MTDTIKMPDPRKPRATKPTAAEQAPIAAAATRPTVTPEPVPAPEPAKPPTKQAQLAALVTRDTGTTLEQMMAATGWLPHTTRAALTGLKKRGYAITSDKIDGVRTYRAVAPEVA